MKKYKIGYTQGVFDMFHIGHLNLINRAKDHCEFLIVGVNADLLVEKYKHKIPVVNEINRAHIIRNLKAVDQCEIVHTLDKIEIHKKFNFEVIFIGDDWKGNPRWIQTEYELAAYGAKVLYLPHTTGISSTILREEKDNCVKEITSGVSQS